MIAPEQLAQLVNSAVRSWLKRPSFREWVREIVREELHRADQENPERLEKPRG